MLSYYLSVHLTHYDNYHAGIVSWLIIMAKLVIVGSGSVMLCSMGYSTAPTSSLIKVMSLLGLGFVILFTFIPAFFEGKFLVDSNGKKVRVSIVL